MSRQDYDVWAIPDERVAERIEVQQIPGVPKKLGPCWIWMLSKTPNGYGQFKRQKDYKQTRYYVHRYTFEVYHGPIPPHHEVHHDCHIRPCCNPGHLRAVTHQVNLILRRNNGIKRGVRL